MFQFFKPWLMPFAFIIATQISVVRADSIRVVGPNGQIQSAPTFSEPLQRAQLNSAEPSRFYGPTRGSETLWSIASRLRPDNSVSVQQTLLAIYRLNPQAFENQNIHSLLPASNLRVPSLEQARASSTQQAINIMNSHLAKLDAPATKPTASKPKVAQAPSRPDVAPKNAQPKAKVSEPKVVDKSIIGNQEIVSNKPLTGAKEMNHLEKQLELSETELLSLEEKNHQLRLMLSNVQLEVDELKTELSDEDRIRSEVEKLLDEERRKNAEIEKMAPSAMDELLSNGWLVAALAIIPGLLLGLIIVMLIGRRSKNEEQQQTTQEQPIQTEPSSVAPITLGDEMDDLNELSLDDDLFGTEDDANKLFDDQALAEEDDVFAGLDESDLDFNLDGEDDDPFASIGENGDLDTNFDDLDLDSSNGISVNGEEKALGLEEMERALDKSAESALDTDEVDFDLSDDNAMSADDIEALLSKESETEDLGSNELDQSLLDDLFSLDDEDDDSFDIDALISEEQSDSTSSADTSITDDFDIDALISEQQSDATPSNISNDDFDIDALISEQQTTQSAAPSVEDDIDDIFAQVAAQNEQANDPFNLDSDDEIATNLNNGLASDDDIENILSQFDKPIVDEETQDSVDLLDEQLEGDDVDLSNSTELLDEMLGDESDDEPESEPLGFDALSELEELSGLSTDDELNIAEDSTETLDELIGDSDDDFELDAESTDLLDDFLDSELSDDALSADEADSPKSESLDPFDDLLTSGIEDELESEEQTFDKELDAAFSSDKASDDLIKDSDVEHTQLTSEPSEAEPEQITDITETPQQPELVGDAPLDSELIQDGADVKPENDEDFNRDDFIDDLFGVAPATDALLDDALETTDEALIDELMTSDDSDSLQATKEPDEASIECALEPEQTSLSDSHELSPEEAVSSVKDDELDIDSLFSENSDFDKPVFEEPTQEDTEQQELEPKEADVQHQREDIAASTEDQASPSSLNDISEDDEETVEDWLAEAIDDVESPANIDSDFDFEPKIQGSDELENIVESLPEPVRAAHMPEIIPNEFGVPEDNDWLIGDDTAKEDALAEVDAEADVEVIPEPVAPTVDSQLDAEPQAETEPQVDATEQAEVPAQDSEEEFSFDDFELPEFNEEDALAEADAEADVEVIPEPVTPAVDSQLDAEPKVESAPQVDALAEADAEADVEVIPEPVVPAVDSQLDAEPQSETAPQAEATEQAEVLGQEDEFSFDDFELPEFGEEDALAEVVSEPDEAQLEQDLAPEAEKFEFDDLDLPEYDEESAKADSVLDDIEQSSAEPVAEEEGVEFDELDLPEYGEDEAISDAFAEKPTPLTSFSPQGEEQDALHDLFSNPQSFSQADDFSDTEGFSGEAGFSDAEESELTAFAQPDDSPSSSSGLNSTPLESNSAPTAVQDEPLEGFDDFDETALAELLSEDVQDSVDNMFEKPLDATSIDSAGLDIDAMLEVGGEDWKGFNLAPEQQSSMHNGVPDDQQEIWASAEKQAEPKIKEENWGQQDNLTESGNSRDKQYMTIDELMAQVEQEGEEAINPDDEELKLDVGLNEFPDVIGDIGNYDVDNNAEAAGKLDLAKIYIEMSDSQGAIKLLEEAIVDGSDDIRREAKNLIDTLNGR
ncbi:FimV/HubP family polar landmark protein [Vibrio splendidus]|uniref:FimV/HubP family polar landmark protein n=1 Tax=Vibrio splendidus TaxID=29497 RepID=UPI00030BF5D4|nr:FimV/HubP family polar landmark protein [Vibrio splendidus]MDP2589064.1 FimV/HubP family polar landmark protein [Vibrio splendidus]OEE52312.1 ATPase [Vibrio splendidus FF-500]